MKISIIVPVYNGAETIGQCLEALCNLDYPAAGYEIIVINDGSIDNTRQVVEQYPVQLINLEQNSGRIIARKTGAEAAKYENLLFVDARVVVNRDILKQFVKIDYQPLMAGEHGEDKYRGPFDTLFYLIRKKVYAPYFPQREWGEELWIDLNNFDKAPKGTTCLFCSRELFLNCLPSDKSKRVNDDVHLLKAIVNNKKLLRHTALKINYLQRSDLKAVLLHIYERGPRFANYYLCGAPSRYYNIWRALIFVLLGIIASAFYCPVWLYYELLLLLTALAGVSLFLAESFKDFLIIFIYFPLIALTFLAGIIKGKLLSR